MNNRTTQLLTKLLDKDKSRSALSRAITLLESQLPSDRYQANLLLDALVQKDSIHRNTAPNACHHSNFSVGIAGAPGSGKSTFIERLGLDYILQKKNSMKDIEQRDEESNDQNDCKLAVLCIDPSSNRSGGSILGDKTRMVELSRHDRAFVRPSPNSGTLGGVNCNTADSVVACQAAGYDWTIIETVGLGQSEVEIDYVCDMVILVLAPAAGDDLQGVKKGIMEIADMVVVNKADGHFLNSCKRTVSDYRSAIQFVQRKYDSWSPPVLMASSLTGEGMADVWANIQKFEIFVRSNGELDNKRISQSGYWMWRHVEEEIKSNIRKDPTLVKKETEVHQMLQSGMISPRSAASTLLLSTFPSSNCSTSDNHDLT